MAVVNITFDSVQLTYHIWSEEDADIPSVVRTTLNGTKQRHIANFTEDNYVRASGFMKSADYASMRTKFAAGTVANLVDTFGTVSAQLVKCSRGLRPGYRSGIDHFVDAELVWIKLGAYS